MAPSKRIFAPRIRPKRSFAFILAIAWLPFFGTVVSRADEPVPKVKSDQTPQTTQRLLLIGGVPDGHPYSTHEFMAAHNLVAKLLSKTPALQTVVVKAEGKWTEGPELLDGADAVVLYLGQGPVWIQQEPTRLKAFQRLAARGGGLTVLHWGMGTKDAKYIAEFVKLFGGCHGGPDRKYKELKVQARPADETHPILHGIRPFQVEDEFYYALKVPQPADGIAPLIQIPVDGKNETVGWAWQRPDGGRSFGFSGLHFHHNWELPEYRRLVAQGVLWTLGRPIPEGGLNVDVTHDDLTLAPREK